MVVEVACRLLLAYFSLDELLPEAVEVQSSEWWTRCFVVLSCVSDWLMVVGFS